MAVFYEWVRIVHVTWQSGVVLIFSGLMGKTFLVNVAAYFLSPSSGFVRYQAVHPKAGV